MDPDSTNASLLKRCSSVPHIDLQQPTVSLFGNNAVRPTQPQIMATITPPNGTAVGASIGSTSVSRDSNSSSSTSSSCSAASSTSFIGFAAATSPLSSTLPPSINIFGRMRRYSASFSPLAAGGSGVPPRLTPRVSQLRQEECADISNSREVTHEREVHSALQISQSCEDLTLDAESWTMKSGGGADAAGSEASSAVVGDHSNPLHVSTVMSNCLNGTGCSSPSPTNRTPIRMPYHNTMSPSPTRRTFTTRRSMSPCNIKPSSLGVKRKFEMDDFGSACSPPPFKKVFSDSRGGSPICQSPHQLTCPSPDSTEGRCTPKLFLSKLCTNSSSSFSSSSSPSTTAAPSPSMEIPIELPVHIDHHHRTHHHMHHEPMATGGSSDDDDDECEMPCERMVDHTKPIVVLQDAAINSDTHCLPSVKELDEDVDDVKVLADVSEIATTVDSSAVDSTITSNGLSQIPNQTISETGDAVSTTVAEAPKLV